VRSGSDCYHASGMRDRLIIIHGWSDSPGGSWFPWLKAAAEQEGFEVLVPAMPEPDAPAIEAWVPFLRDTVGTLDGRTYLVGHSVGCQTALRVLAETSGTAGGTVFVAPWLELTTFETEEEREIAKPWIETPIDFTAARAHAGPLVAFFSDDDPWVPPSNAERFRELLGAETHVEHGKKHYFGGDGITEVPQVLEALLRLRGAGAK
jgi:predicted alpha/beta hydrolase family esterase